MTRTATLIGATGLIGGHLFRLLQTDGSFTSIRVLARRPFATDDPHVDVRIVDFADADALRAAIAGSDAVFCAVGTTQKKVQGDRQAYRKVDFDIPALSARMAAETGARHYALVSAVGANPASRNFYLRIKGEAEEAVRASGVSSISVYRPSMLLGTRAERRPAERIGQILMSATAPLFVGGLRKYRAIDAEDVAAAMLASARIAKEGYEVLHFDEISARANSLFTKHPRRG